MVSPYFRAPMPKIRVVEDLNSDFVLSELILLSPYDAGDRSVAGVKPDKAERFALRIRMGTAKHRAVLAQILSDGVLNPGLFLRLVDQSHGNQTRYAFAAPEVVCEFRCKKEDVQKPRSFQVTQLRRAQSFRSYLARTFRQKMSDGFRCKATNFLLFDLFGDLVESRIARFDEVLAAELLILKCCFRDRTAARVSATANGILWLSAHGQIARVLEMDGLLLCSVRVLYVTC
jgi:hypothetical protein